MPHYACEVIPSCNDAVATSRSRSCVHANYYLARDSRARSAGKHSMPVVSVRYLDGSVSGRRLAAFEFRERVFEKRRRARDGCDCPVTVNDDEIQTPRCF